MQGLARIWINGDCLIQGIIGRPWQHLGIAPLINLQTRSHLLIAKKAIRVLSHEIVSQYQLQLINDYQGPEIKQD